MKSDDESQKAVAKAMALLLHKDRTEKELSDRLYRAGFSEESALFAMEYVKSFGYIDDHRYAATYIDYHKLSKSRREISRKLIEKGIPEDILHAALSERYNGSDEGGESADAEDVALQSVISKRLKGRDISELTFEEKQKEMRYLAGKGYPADKIRGMFS